MVPLRTRPAAYLQGAQAGIGVGVAIPIFAALVVCGILLYRRRKRKPVAQESYAGKAANAQPPSYPSAEQRKPATEMAHEGRPKYYEMNSQTAPTELEGH